MGHINIDGALGRLRGLAQRIIAGDAERSAALSLAEQCVEIDEYLLCGGILPKDWDIGKKLRWHECKDGSCILMLNDYAVGRVIIDHHPPKVTWRADLKPTESLPYIIRNKANIVDSLGEAKMACEKYVRNEIRKPFDPWEALHKEGII